MPAVNYFPDCRMSYPGFDESILCGYDRIFTTKSFHVDYLKDRLGPDKVQFLHHGYMTGVHAPPDLSAPLFNTDILYIGNHSLEKESWLFSVKRRFPRLRIKIFGNRWQNAHCSTILGESVTGGPVYGRDYAAAIHSAKINLGIHMGITDSSGWYDRVSTRTFEIPACKGFMLHVDNEEVRQLFVPGVEIDVFKNIEELFEKIEYYLVRDDIRREMVERAYNRCVPAYSYDARARVIADWLLSEKMAVQ
ncbi:MAG TPA: glycosyltransferase [Thermodesulfovibrionales bacterium]|nr:glycosyltransferase [Thermodesulfovibrionales bacterium]